MSSEPIAIAARVLRSRRHDLATARRLHQQQRDAAVRAAEERDATANVLAVLELRVTEAEQQLLRIARGDA